MDINGQNSPLKLRTEMAIVTLYAKLKHTVKNLLIRTDYLIFAGGADIEFKKPPNSPA